MVDLQTATKEELLEQFKNEEDPRGDFIPWFEETVMDKAAYAMETYDQMIHKIGLTLLAVPTAVGYQFDGDAATTIDKAFTEAWEDTYVSEAFGIEQDSALAMWMNIGASILFDPITWVTAGGSSSWKWSTKLLNDPKMAGTFIRQPHIQSGIRHIVNGQDSRVITSMIRGSMYEDDVVRLMGHCHNTVR